MFGLFKKEKEELTQLEKQKELSKKEFVYIKKDDMCFCSNMYKVISKDVLFISLLDSFMIGFTNDLIKGYYKIGVDATFDKKEYEFWKLELKIKKLEERLTELESKVNGKRKKK